MTIEAIETICDQFTAVTKDINGGIYALTLAEKMFLITSPDANVAIRAANRRGIRRNSFARWSAPATPW